MRNYDICGRIIIWRDIKKKAFKIIARAGSRIVKDFYKLYSRPLLSLTAIKIF